MERSVLVVGGRGYIGRRLNEYLRTYGYKVVSLDIGWFPAITDSGIEDWVGDVRDIGPEDVRGFYGVCFLASTAMPDHERRLRFYDAYVANFDGLVNLVQCCKRVGVERLTLASTTSVLGYVARGNGVDETHVPEPDERYGEVKLICETYLRRERCGRFHPVILRQGTVYGVSPRMRFDLVVNAMVKTAFKEKKIYIFGDRDLCRPLVYIGDVCEAHRLSLERAPRFSGEVFHLAYGSYTLGEIAEIVRRVTGAKIVEGFKSADRRSYRATTLKVRRWLFQPQVSVEMGAKEVLRALKMGKIEDPDSDIYYNSRYLPTLVGKEE